MSRKFKYKIIYIYECIVVHSTCLMMHAPPSNRLLNTYTRFFWYKQNDFFERGFGALDANQILWDIVC